MNKVALKICYNGMRFHGSQRQPNVHTVEDEIINGLNKLNADYKDFKTTSRTDKGVSALNNIVSFKTDFNINELQRALNSKISDVRILGHTEVSKDYDPRYDTISKTYRYYIPDHSEKYSIEKLKRISGLFEGKNDFKNFCKEDNRDTFREIYGISVKSKNIEVFNLDLKMVDIRGKSFLWEMVRRIITGMKKFSSSELSYEDLETLIEVKEIDKLKSSKAENLILVDVKAPGLEFRCDDREKNRIKDTVFDLVKDNTVQAHQGISALNKLSK